MMKLTLLVGCHHTDSSSTSFFFIYLSSRARKQVAWLQHCTALLLGVAYLQGIKGKD